MSGGEGGGGSAQTVAGTWAMTMRTPIGSIRAELVLWGEGDDLQGSASSEAETVELRNLHVSPAEDGHRITWSQSITTPLRLNLDFDVVLSGDRLHGHSRAGRLPRSTVTGARISGGERTR